MSDEATHEYDYKLSIEEHPTRPTGRKVNQCNPKVSTICPGIWYSARGNVYMDHPEIIFGSTNEDNKSFGAYHELTREARDHDLDDVKQDFNDNRLVPALHAYEEHLMQRLPELYRREFTLDHDKNKKALGQARFMILRGNFSKDTVANFNRYWPNGSIPRICEHDISRHVVIAFTNDEGKLAPVYCCWNCQMAPGYRDALAGDDWQIKGYLKHFKFQTDKANHPHGCAEAACCMRCKEAKAPGEPVSLGPARDYDERTRTYYQQQAMNYRRRP